MTLCMLIEGLEEMSAHWEKMFGTCKQLPTFPNQVGPGFEPRTLEVLGSVFPTTMGCQPKSFADVEQCPYEVGSNDMFQIH